MRPSAWRSLIVGASLLALSSLDTLAQDRRLGPGPDSWTGDLSPIAAGDWSYDRAAQLLERAGFGGTPEDIRKLAAMSPEQAVRSLINIRAVDNSHLKPFVESGVWDPTLANFPKSRVAATQAAAKTGESMGVRVRDGGNRRMQPVVDRFFYWLRATELENLRLANWWADRMVATRAPLQEKMALFWHGHFATGENKIRDYRKMVKQLALFHDKGLGNFRELLIGVAQDSAMLAYLDAGENVKGAPNENFGREVMELFTMGVGNYTEKDIREAARAFTGWTADDRTLQFIVHPELHDDGPKTFLGRAGNFDGKDILNIILEQPVTAKYVASKVYRFFVHEDPSPELQERLGKVLREGNYEIAPLMTAIFLSHDFYGPRAYATRIKGPVEYVVSTYRKLGQGELPGVPDFNRTTAALGQRLLNPPTVAGWPRGRGWMTPASAFDRGNFALEVLMPDLIEFSDPTLNPGAQDREVNRRYRLGYDIRQSTVERDPMAGGGMNQPMNMADVIADANEDFNTRISGSVGFQQAQRKMIPIVRAPARIDLVAIVKAEGLQTTDQVVDAFMRRFLMVMPDPTIRQSLVAFLDEQLSTTKIADALTFMDEPLRLLVHMIMSLPEYQLG